jgi:hypothetical protein
MTTSNYLIQQLHRMEYVSYASTSDEKQVKLSLSKAVEAHRVVGRRDFSHFLDNRLTDSVEDVGHMCWSPFIHKNSPGTQSY